MVIGFVAGWAGWASFRRICRKKNGIPVFIIFFSGLWRFDPPKPAIPAQPATNVTAMGTSAVTGLLKQIKNRPKMRWLLDYLN
jgi:hypothetical protein